MPAHVDVAQHPEEVGELVAPPQDARAGEDARVRLLHEVLRVVGVAAHGPRRPEQAVDVPARVLGIEEARHGWDAVRRPPP